MFAGLPNTEISGEAFIACAGLARCIYEMDSSCDSIGIDVPESSLSRQRKEPIMANDTRIAVDVAMAVFEIAVSGRPGQVQLRARKQRAQFLDFMAQQPVAT